MLSVNTDCHVYLQTNGAQAQLQITHLECQEFTGSERLPPASLSTWGMKLVGAAVGKYSEWPERGLEGKLQLAHAGLTARTFRGRGHGGREAGQHGKQRLTGNGAV